MRRVLASLFLLAAVPGPARCAEIVLENGARILAEERPATETAAVRLVIGGGDLDEPPGRHGVSDLHAAMLLRGTRARTGFAQARAGEELGGRLSARSRPAAESIAIEVPSENLEPAIRLVVETFLEPRFSPEDLAKEKTLLAGSLATARDEPKTLLEDALYRTLFSSHPLSRLANLTEAEIKTVGIEDVRAIHRTRLDAGRVALIVVGNCSAARVEALGRELLSGLPATARPGGRLLVPSLKEPPSLSTDVKRRVDHRTTQPILAIGVPTPGVSDREMPAFLLLKHLLAGFDERLYTEIREKRGYAYWVTAEGYEFPWGGAFGISTGAKEKFFPEIERILREQLSRIAAEPVKAEELKRAVKYLRTEEARNDETNAGRVVVIGNELVDGAPARTYEERVDRLSAVTPGEIRDLARRFFAGKHVAIVSLF